MPYRYILPAICAFFLLSLPTSAQAPSPVDEAFGQYQFATAAAEQKQADDKKALQQKYTAALTRLKNRLDPFADAGAMLAIAAEIKSLTSDQAVNAGEPGEKLLAARATYQKALGDIQRSADKQRITTTAAAIAELKKLTGSLAAADDLDGALAAEQKRRELESDEAYVAAKRRLAAAPAPAATPGEGLRRSDDLNQAIPRNGLFAYFPLDGRLNDTKGETVPRVGGPKRFASGLSGRALDLARPEDGDRPNIGFPLPGGGRSDFSVSFCIKPDMSAHSSKVIFTAGKEGDSTPFSVNYIQSGDVGGEALYDPPGDGWHHSRADLPRPEPEWHHVLITATKEEASYYLDGKLLLTLKPHGESINFIGMHGYIGTSRRWSGSGDDREIRYGGGPDMLLDELAVYERELTSADARALAKNYGLFDDGR